MSFLWRMPLALAAAIAGGAVFAIAYGVMSHAMGTDTHQMVPWVLAQFKLGAGLIYGLLLRWAMQ